MHSDKQGSANIVGDFQVFPEARVWALLLPKIICHQILTLEVAIGRSWGPWGRDIYEWTSRYRHWMSFGRVPRCTPAVFVRVKADLPLPESLTVEGRKKTESGV